MSRASTPSEGPAGLSAGEKRGRRARLRSESGWAAPALAVAAVAAYASSFTGTFVFDDVDAIRDNPTIRHLWPIWRIFSPPSGGLTVSGRPVLNATLAVNYAVSGLHAWSYHAANLLIHIVAALALFGILRHSIGRWSGSPGDACGPARVTDRPSVSGPVVASLRRGKRAAPPVLVPFCVALLWEVHPLQTESVTYIVQRAESLMGMLYLLSLYCFIRYTQSETGGFFTGRSGGMPSKPFLQEDRKDREGRHLGGSFIPGPATETTAVLPDLPDLPVKKTTASQPLRDLCDLPVKKDNSTKACFPTFLSEKHWLGKSACAVLSVICCALAMGTKEVAVSIPVVVFLYDRTFVSGSFRGAWRRRWGYYAALAAPWLMLAALVFSTHGRGGTSGPASGISAAWYWPTQIPAIVAYLRLAVWPQPLVFDYATEWVRSFWPILPSAAALAAAMAVTAWGLASRRPMERGRRALGFAGFFFFAILAPTSIVPGGRQTMAEHRMYLALIPVIAVLVGALAHLCAPPFLHASRIARGIFAAAIVAAALACIALTARRNLVYRSALSLWTDTVAKRPGNAFALTNLGVARFALGQPAEATALFRKSLELDPLEYQAEYNLGVVSAAGGRVDEAIAHYRRSIDWMPGYSKARTNLGVLLLDTGRVPESISQLEEALRADPDYTAARVDLGNALAAAGRTSEAIAQYETALGQNPDAAGIHGDLGNALKQTGHDAEAMAQYAQALRLDPNYAEAHNNRGVVFSDEGRLPEAMAEFEAALTLEPKSVDAHENLGAALAQSGRLEEAETQFAAAVRLAPGNAAAHNAMGGVLSQLGRPAEAEPEYEAALRIDPRFAQAQANLGVTLAGLGRMDEAIDHLTRAVRISPNFAEAQSNLGAALGAVGRLSEALEHNREAVRLRPDNPDIRANYAAILQQAGRQDEAKAQAEKAADLRRRRR